jgi:hypothetical protein
MKINAENNGDRYWKTTAPIAVGAALVAALFCRPNGFRAAGAHKGRPYEQAQFGSFNFPNTLIWGPGSRARPITYSFLAN